MYYTGLHAREHIALASGAFWLYDLLMNPESYGKDFNFHLLTVANPDGYVHSKTEDKMWRKNRKPIGSNSKCFGVDLNRNFGFKHGVSGTEMKNSCEENYSSKPFSEHESKGAKMLVRF